MFKDGFTLIELVMVIVVIAILAVTAIPKPADTLSMRAEMVARKIQSDIRYTQSLATGTQRNTLIEFRSQEDDYAVYIEQVGGGWARALNPVVKTDFVVQLNSGEFSGVGIESVSFNGYQGLVFDRWGNPYGYDPNTGTDSPLDNPAGIMLTEAQEIIVERGTGRVHIK